MDNKIFQIIYQNTFIERTLVQYGVVSGNSQIEVDYSSLTSDQKNTVDAFKVLMGTFIYPTELTQCVYQINGVPYERFFVQYGQIEVDYSSLTDDQKTTVNNFKDLMITFIPA